MHRSRLLYELASKSSPATVIRTRSALQRGTFGQLYHDIAPNNKSADRFSCPSITNSTTRLATRPHKKYGFAACLLFPPLGRNFSLPTNSSKANVSGIANDGEKVEDISQGEKGNEKAVGLRHEENSDPPDIETEFPRSEKATLAAQLNLRARLPKDGGPQSTWDSLLEIWRLIMIARREVKTMGLAFCLILIGSSISISIPYSIGKILDQATKPTGGIEQVFGMDLTTFYVILGGLITVGAGAAFGRIVILRMVGERIVARLRSQLFRRTYTQNAEFFDANRTGDLISRLSSDTQIVGKAITNNLSEGLRSIISGAAGIGAMVYVSPDLTLLMAVIGPPVALGSWLYGRKIRVIGRKVQDNLGTLTKIAEERLGNVKTSQSFAGEILEVARYNKQTKNIFKLGVKESLYNGLYFSSLNLAGNSTILIMLWFGSSMVKSGVISIGELTSFLLYTGFAGSSLTGLSNVYSEMMKGVGAASRLFDLQDAKPTISPTVGLPVKSARGPITFENLSFSYPTRPGVQIFDKLDFEIPQGSNIAIVGPSGGGKSTISSLLLRFYLPTKGAIKIDGVDISKMNVKSLRRRIGVVAQEPVLFSGTIAQNIAYSKPNATRAEIVAAARQANCQQFVASLPDGLETSVGARGTQLSGGQKQRIAIARALLKNPDILILDEATSALDAESETLVNSALANLLRGSNTTISIAHRLSTIKRADTIIVLSADGKVAEQGPYSELSKDPNGAFTKLMEWQMHGGETSMAPLSSQADKGEHEPDDLRLNHKPDENQPDEEEHQPRKEASANSTTN